MLVLSSLTSSPPPFSNTSIVLQRRTGTIMLRSLPMTAALVSISPLQGTQHVPSQRMSKTNMCLCFSKLKIMADKEVDVRRDDDMMLFRHQTLLDIRSGQELLSRLKKESEYGRLPGNVASALKELYENYRNAVFSSENPHAEEIFLSNMSAMLDCVLLDLEDPFIFPPYHKAVRKPYDYYAFGQNFMRPLFDFGSSYVGNIAIFHEMEEKRQQGHNIILMSNHQTEADPAIIASLLEGTNPYIAENTTYVAGDRVVTDPLCKPFSMGRNLICVYSKKHMYDVPELVDMKRRANTRSLKEMALLLRGGSQIIWIAPSGGRDRPDPVTDEWYPASFDISSVDNMRRLMEHAGVPGHVYPLSILCYDIMPPPPQVEKEIGEKRLMSFHGVGLSVAPEISYHNVALHCRNEEEVKSAYADILYDTVNEQYKVLKAAIHGKQGFGASTPAVLLSQPWRPN